MKEKEKKKQVIKISVFITSIFVIFLSVTYAFINMTLVGTRRQVITAGNLELELQEDENNLTITDAMPMYDEVGMMQEAFTFRLINKTETDTNYILKLVDITVGEKLDTNVVKYGLTKEENETIEFLSNLNDNEIDSGVISGNTTIDYSLRLWINSSVEENNVIMGKSLSYRIDVEASQEVEKTGTLWNIYRGHYSDLDRFWCYSPIEESYCEYYDKITRIVFDNKINIPDDAPHSWDMSEEKNGSVMAYVVPNDDPFAWGTPYTLHIQGNGKIYAPVNSEGLFADLFYVTVFENLEYLDTTNVTNMSDMFGYCERLTTLNLSNFDTSKVTDMSDMFSHCKGLTTLDVSNFDTSKVTNMSDMFNYCEGLTTLNLSNFDTSKVTDMSGMFSECSSLTTIDLSNFNTSNVTNMAHMFSGCGSLTTIDLSNFDTSNVTGMSSMFSRCGSLTTIDLSSFDTSKVTNMSSMFSGCSSLTTIDLSNFDTSNVTGMYSMFSRCGSLTTIDLSNFNTSKVTDMSYMFSKCSSLTTIDLSNFDTSKVTNMRTMFSECSSLTTIDLSNFDTSKVTNMRSMFYNCSSLISIDLSSFEISSEVDLTNMFDSVKNSCTIVVKNIEVKNRFMTVNSKLTNVIVKTV